MTDMVRTVTDRFIELGHRYGRALTPIEVLKFLYFTEGWHLALTGAPLFDEEFEAWRDGPVLRSAYRRLKVFGSNPISYGTIDTNPEQSLSLKALKIVDRVYDFYSTYTVPELVGLTHLPGSPWTQIREFNGIPSGANAEDIIPIEVIREWFDSVWDASLTPESVKIIDIGPNEQAEWAAA